MKKIVGLGLAQMSKTIVWQSQHHHSPFTANHKILFTNLPQIKLFRQGVFFYLVFFKVVVLDDRLLINGEILGYSTLFDSKT